MQLTDIAARTPPAPWAEGDNIPWNDPDFSAAMLKEHLSQEHDAASRRAAKIDAHVAWIHSTLLDGRPGRVLDLGCGPGLYTARLAALGHTCRGIDFSPASIDYARRQAAGAGPACAYTLADLRRADYGAGFDSGFGQVAPYDLVMLLYGEFNVFKPADSAAILAKARAVLAPGGKLLLEPHTFAALERMGRAAPGWWTAADGLFSPRPHLVLEEHFWHSDLCAATTRYFVVDAAEGEVRRYAASYQAYSDEGYAAALAQAGFAVEATYPSLTGAADPTQADLFALVARPV